MTPGSAAGRVVNIRSSFFRWFCLDGALAYLPKIVAELLSLECVASALNRAVH
jgi:hypothetical protein